MIAATFILNWRSLYRAFLPALLVISLLTSCTAEARKNRHVNRAEKYFAAEEYEKGKIEYLNVIRSDQKDAQAFKRMAAIWLEQGAPLRAAPFLVRARDLAPEDPDNHIKFARILISLGALAEARKEGLAALEKDPANGEAILILAETAGTQEDLAALEQTLQRFPDQNAISFHVATATLALRKNDLPAAERAFRAAAAADPKSPQPHAGLAVLALFQRNKSQAAEELKTAADLSPIRSQQRIQYADFQAQTGAGAEARESLKAITAKAPDFLPAWRLLAQIAFNEKKYDESLGFLEKIFALDPDNLDGRMVEVQVRAAKGEVNKVVDSLQHLDKTYPKVPAIKLQLARAYLLNNNMADAVTTLNETIATYPEFVDAKLLLGEVKLRMGEAPAVGTAMADLLKTRPNLVQAQGLLAEAYRAQGRLDEAASVFREQLKVVPKDPAANLGLAVVLRQQNKTAEARTALEKVLEAAPGNAMAADQLVDLEIGEKAFDAAMLRARTQLAATSESAGAHALVGKVFAAQGQFDKAEAAFAKATEIDPNFSAAYDGLIGAYVAQDKLPQAAAKLEEFISKHPENPAPLMTVALIYDKMREFSKAAAAYEKLVAIKPDFAVAFNNLAYLYAERLDQLEKGAEAARKARSLQPGEASIADTLGWILYRQGDYQQALSLLEESAAKLGDNPEIQFHLGSARYMNGRTEDARSALQKAANSTTEFPGKEEARRRLQMLGDSSRGPTELSIADLESLIKQQPADVITLTRLGSAYQKDAQFAKAAAAFEQALKINPKLGAATVELAQIYAGPLHNKEKALELAKKARELAPTDPKVAAIIGKLAYETGNFSWSYSLLQEAVRQLPDDAAIQYSYAWAAYSLGKVTEAQEAMRRVAEAVPDTPEGQTARSFLAMLPMEASGPSGEADTVEVQNLVVRDPTFVPALMAQAASIMQRGDAKAAAAIYESIARRLPDFAPASKYLAALYAEDPALQSKAYDVAMKARKALPDDPELAQTLSLISYNRKEYSRAIQFSLEGERRKGLSPKTLYYLGMSYLRTNKPTEARNALKRALEAGLSEPLKTEAAQVLTELTGTGSSPK